MRQNIMFFSSNKQKKKKKPMYLNLYSIGTMTGFAKEKAKFFRTKTISNNCVGTWYLYIFCIYIIYYTYKYMC